MNARSGSATIRRGGFLGKLGLGVLAVAIVGAIFGSDEGSTTTEARPSSSASPSSVVTSGAPSPTASPSPTATHTAGTASEETRFLEVVDGDTITTRAGTVRIIGIDTPERGQCGHQAASLAISELLSRNDVIHLELPEGQNDEDRYGRLIRYVTTEDGVDLGMMQILAGHAVARFDSTDGYPEHPRQADYHAAQIATLDADGTILTAACLAEREAAANAPPVTEEPRDVVDGSEETPWYMQYPSCAALKRNTVGDPTGPFDRDNPAEVDIYDWFQYGTGHRGDGDGDGLACE